MGRERKGSSRKADKDVKDLHAMFGHVDVDTIRAVLGACGGDMNAAAESLICFEPSPAASDPAASSAPAPAPPASVASAPESSFWADVVASAAEEPMPDTPADVPPAPPALEDEAPAPFGTGSELASRFSDAPGDFDPSGVERLVGRRVEEDGSISYLTKRKGLAFVRCLWVPAAHLQGGAIPPLQRQRVIKFEEEHGSKPSPLVLVPEDNLAPERVVASRPASAGGEEYLVKWRGLQHADATWEAPEAAGAGAVARYWELRGTHAARAAALPAVRAWVAPRGAEVAMPTGAEGQTLRPYQEESLKWNAFNWEQGRSCILADEMGLGKTVQAATFLEHVRLAGCPRPSLVVVPLSTLVNWERELARWCHSSTVVSYYGTATSRALIRQHEWHCEAAGEGEGEPAPSPTGDGGEGEGGGDEPTAKRAKPARKARGGSPPGALSFDILLTTYETVSADRAFLAAVPWEALVVDEAHRLKKAESKLGGDLKALQPRHRLLLSGTPLQNNVSELWALLTFLDPVRFSSLPDFEAQFGSMQSAAEVEALHGELRPYLLRRLKADVEASLLPRVETLVECHMTPLQRMCYRALFERNFAYLEAGCSSSSFPAFRNLMMQLRKCCNHPFLLEGVEEAAAREKAAAGPGGGGGAAPARTAVTTAAELAAPCGKLLFLGKLLESLRAGGRRVLIFSQMTRVLDILQDYCGMLGYPLERLDGGVTGAARQAAVDRFSAPGSDRFVFLLSTRAGGLGINLVAADTVVVYDSDWNPQNDAQALARCHRIGQTKEVRVFRLVTAKSYEQRMLDCANRKLGLERAIFGMGGGDGEEEEEGGRAGAPSASGAARAEIDRLLREGAHAALQGAEDDGEGRDFMAASVEEVLARSATTTVDASAGGGGGGGFDFATATFVAAGQEEAAVDVDDPDFWEKLLPEAAEAEKRRAEEAALAREAEQNEDAADRVRRNTSSWPWPERKRALSAMLLHGWGSWHNVLRAAKLEERKTVEELAAFCSHYVLECVRFARGTFDTRPSVAAASAELGRLGGGAGGGGRDECFNERQFLQHVEGRADEDLARLDLLQPLVDAVHAAQMEEGAGGEETGGEPPRPPLPPAGAGLKAPTAPALPRSQAAQLPAVWWAPEHDDLLLLGTYKHGYGKYSELLADAALGFQAAYEAAGGGAGPPPPSGEEAGAGAGAGEGSGDGPVKMWPEGRALSTRLRRLLACLADPHLAAEDKGGGGSSVSKSGIKRVRVARPPSSPPRPLTKEEKAARAHAKMLAQLAAMERGPGGAPVLPLQLGGLVLEALGELQPGREGWSTATYLLPRGYKARRHYCRMDKPEEKCYYTMEIIEGADPSSPPMFLLTPEEGGTPILHKSATGAWSEVLRAVSAAREAKGEEAKKTAMSGPEQYGLTLPLVRALMEGLPGAQAVRGYTALTF